MDDWWLLLRRLKHTPTEINNMTYPEMKLEVMLAYEDAILRQNVNERPPENSITTDMNESTRDASMAALAKAFKQSKGG